jgi:hypothetical protein
MIVPQTVKRAKRDDEVGGVYETVGARQRKPKQNFS